MRYRRTKLGSVGSSSVTLAAGVFWCSKVSSWESSSRPLSSADLNESFSDVGDEIGDAVEPLENLRLPLVATTELWATSK